MITIKATGGTPTPAGGIRIRKEKATPHPKTILPPADITGPHPEKLPQH
jgi:hypothetical protein